MSKQNTFTGSALPINATGHRRDFFSSISDLCQTDRTSNWCYVAMVGVVIAAGAGTAFFLTDDARFVGALAAGLALMLISACAYCCSQSPEPSLVVNSV